jgi:hypothetical protein
MELDMMWLTSRIVWSNVSHALMILCSIIMVSGCAHDDHNHDDEEAIVRMTLVLTDVQSATAVRASWAQPGGPGTTVTIDTLQLQAGRSYIGQITLTGASGSDITEVVRTLGTEHQFFFTPEEAAASRVNFTITDRDTRSLPVGLQFNVAVQSGVAVTNGRVRIELSHFDDPNQKNGSNRSSETDIDIRMPIRIR